MPGLLDIINRKRRGLLGPVYQDANAVQGLLDSSPVGSVGAPSGVLPNPNAPTGRDPVLEGLAMSSFVPGIGDIAGLAADIRMYQTQPESRTLSNFGLTALGALPFIPAMTVFHGSPHKFDAFDLSKIGTGEGAQAYGHGIYLAESKKVADQYAGKLSEPLVEFSKKAPETDTEKAVLSDLITRAKGTQYEHRGSAINERWKQIANPMSDELYGNATFGIKALPPDELALRLKKAEAARALGPPNIYDTGSLYTVDLSDDQIAKMLDWDAPLSEQPDSVKQALEKVASWGGGDLTTRMGHKPASWLLGEISEGMPGGTQSPELSKALMEAGIPGIKYYDGGSRAAGEGTRNFVVFDDKLPKILKRE